MHPFHHIAFFRRNVSAFFDFIGNFFGFVLHHRTGVRLVFENIIDGRRLPFLY